MVEQDGATGLLIPKGARPPARTWQCRKGHRRSASHPFRLKFLIGDEVVMETNPLCAVCFRAWLERQFGTHEVKVQASRVRRLGDENIQTREVRTAPGGA